MSACKHCDEPATRSGLCEDHASLAEHYARDDAREPTPEPAIDPWAPETVPAEPAAITRERLQRFWLPDALFDQRLTAPQLSVFVFLSRLAGRSSECWAGRGTIASRCCLSGETVTTAVNRLVELRMVERQSRAAFGKSNRYRILPVDQWRTVSGSPANWTAASVSGSPAN